MTTRTTALHTGLDDFLAWAQKERGVTLPVRPADAVLTLLALRGADRRAGVPEPTPQLLRQVLHEDLPVLLYAPPDEIAALPRVLTALADRVRAAHRLNAKRHARLLDAVAETVPGCLTAMDEPSRLTWPRWYASLLHARGVDTGDAEAVRAGMAALAAAPRADRALPARVCRAHVAARTFEAATVLARALLAASAQQAGSPSPAGPLLPGPPLDTDDPGELDRRAGELADRWTAAGLGEALGGPYADIAPGPEALPHVVLADRMLDEHLDYYGDSSLPLPPPPVLPAPGEIRELLHAAPLPAALAAGVTDDRRELAERCGFPGPATAVWNEGTPQELTELAADILAATVERLAAGSDPADEYAHDAAHVLYALYERGGTPESVARKASDVAGWTVDPDLEEAPFPVPGTAPEAYGTPTSQELSAMLRLPGLTDADRAELDPHAQALAAVVDGLAVTGCVFRAGDAYGLTPLGSAVVRHVLTAGFVAAPDRETFLSLRADGVVIAVRYWPPATAAAALGSWTAERGGGDEVWSELLTALSSVKAASPDDIVPSALFARLDLAAVPSGPLRTALTDPVIGAYARRLLRERGEDVPADAVPPSAHATLLLEELVTHEIADMRVVIEAQVGKRAPLPVPTALRDAFDAAAATWPGGAAALIPLLAATDPAGSLRILEELRDKHPDRRVAALAAHAAKAAGPSAGARARTNRRGRRSRSTPRHR
ncbi:hypothetical protein [Streptomyces sp. SP18CS02]|uniref:hypothetical protein n=1 Tax=Streptomyces sp. SP18CS02 TaxID=3002531 RepID=UPI002E7866A9|nr:hypothetical protein [Streptomyces sp. SP18CS02]MEE1753832.1 hypothetical protein [Streptomyces sp. SP18CS02]